jgi:2-polyprenyl-6-hydroxyphenyl methylase/3-demethylubiquinone-9 3-methyltransferase
VGSAGTRFRDEPQQRFRNDPKQYDDMAAEWWRPHGAFEALHWIAEARGRLIPPAERPGAVLLDVGCGAGLLAPHVAGKGYRHIGVDLSPTALPQAAEHGVTPVRANVQRLPFRDGFADVVSAGEILEHVLDLRATVAEICRVLRPGGLLVLDTIAATGIARFITVTVGERLPHGAPKGIHDPALFVDRRLLADECARHGVPLQLRGVRPCIRDLFAWLAGRTDRVRLVPMRSTAVLFQGRGTKGQASAPTG